MVKEFLPLAKELNLSQAGAQRLIDFHAKAIADMAKAPYAAFEAMTDKWRADAVADKEIGDGSAIRKDVKERVGKVINMLPPDVRDGFKETMNLTGAGDNPAFIKAINWFATKLTEGKHVQGNGPSAAGQTGPNARPRSAAEAIYSHLIKPNS